MKGIEPDGKKLAAVTAYPTPRNSKEVKQFIGLSNYYRRFIPHYAEIAEPLHRLLRKTSKNLIGLQNATSLLTSSKQNLHHHPYWLIPISQIHS